MQRKILLSLVLVLGIILAVVVNTSKARSEKKFYKTHIQGRVTLIEDAGRGLTIYHVGDSTVAINLVEFLLPLPIEQGDSLYKQRNNLELKIFKKKNGTYKLFNAIEYGK